ncbi:hypothetical protein [Pseudomonas sp. PSE14]|uniref:hypothetical protein n=1 Tax=Pseudomonas sp. PSE14 TaxID=3016341 RepID=UPI0023D7C45C|nr:hypothetical protein [Pseudomonas sp. PSE14]WEJ70641.1 hypothetical protein O6P39_18480 [Pseudomonas sp. PSE14]
MMGQDLLVPFVSFDKRNSPEGAKQNTSEHAEAALDTQTRNKKQETRNKSIADKVRSYDSHAPLQEQSLSAT